MVNLDFKTFPTLSENVGKMWEKHYYCSSGESPEILKVDELESDITDLPSCCSNCSRATFVTPPPFLATVTFSRCVVGLISLDSTVVAASANVFRA